MEDAWARGLLEGSETHPPIALNSAILFEIKCRNSPSPRADGMLKSSCQDVLKYIVNKVILTAQGICLVKFVQIELAT